MFSHPWVLLFIPVVIIITTYLSFQKKPGVIFSSVKYFSKKNPFWTFIRKSCPWIYSFSIIAANYGIAEPLGKPIIINKDEIGIDIIISLDLSTSMEAPDFDPDRFTVAKQLAEDFINSRENDRIGLVIFANDAYLLSPPTQNHNFLLNQLRDLEPGQIEDGTAIGMGLVVAANGLRDAKGESKVIILLTDGVNNSGFVDPITAATAAKTLDMKIYCIGIGTDRPFDYYSSTYGYSVQASTADYALLDQLSSSSESSFRATDKNALKKAFKLIDEMEKYEEKVDRLTLRPSKAKFWIILSIILFLIPFIFERTFFRSIPWYLLNQFFYILYR